MPFRDVESCLPPEPVSDSNVYPHYPEGIYEAECLNVVAYRDPQFRRWTARLEFGIVPSGERIFGFLNLGDGEKPASGRRSKYFRAWVIANGAAPRKRQVLTYRTFKRKIFQVRVADTRKNSNGGQHPTGAVYSTVKEIIRRTYP
jgi:hypothetical protein